MMPLNLSWASIVWGKQVRYWGNQYETPNPGTSWSSWGRVKDGERKKPQCRAVQVQCQRSLSLHPAKREHPGQEVSWRASLSRICVLSWFLNASCRSLTNWEERRRCLQQGSAKQEGESKLCTGFPGAMRVACTGSCGRWLERMGSTHFAEAPGKPLRSLDFLGS